MLKVRTTGAVSSEQRAVQELLEPADVEVNGDRPWDLQVHNDDFYRRVLAGGSLAMGESYMDGWWDCEALDGLAYRIMRASIHEQASWSWRLVWNYLKAKLMNLQSPSRAYEVGERHYDLGNDLYEAMLDERMIYSCAYWKDVDTLDAAQEAKLDLICRKVDLQPGMRVLDIGCGWGGFLEYAASKYGVEGMGITVSEEQVRLGRERCAGLPVEIRLQDYRELDETFDRVVSVGMFEHVGPKNYRTFMEVVKRCLHPDGLFLLHTIGSSEPSEVVDPWIEKYIFPNGVIPSAVQITEASEGRFVMEDWHNIGAYYDPTLMAWWENVEQSWDVLHETYDERFYRMWRYYLLMSAGTFQARENQVWQMVYTHDGQVGGYEGIR